MYSHTRTSITKQLWMKRHESRPVVESKEVKTQEDSRVTLALPLASDEDIADQYLNFLSSFRVGPLLEDLDALAG